MPDHPTPEDREWLHDELARILARSGYERFALGPILAPSDEFFPDAYVEGPEGVRTVARRLLAWIDVKLDVRVADETPDVDHRAIPTWTISLRESEGDRAVLRVDERGRAEELPGVLSHVLASVVHARAARFEEQGYRGQPESDDPDLEAELAGIRTIALGWGILAANAAESHLSGSVGSGRYQTFQVVTQTHGALPMVAVVYLLALQLVVRGAGEEAIDRVADLLRPNQRELFRDWARALEGERAALIARLGLPPAASWPEAAPLERPEPFAVEQVDEQARRDRKARTKKKRAKQRNRKRPVFRVAEYDYRPWVFVLGVTGGLAAALAIGAMGLATANSLLLASLFGVSSGGALGFAIAYSRRHDACSDPECAVAMPVGAERCPGCGGRIAGRIASRARRLEAEEALPDEWFVERGLVSRDNSEDA